VEDPARVQALAAATELMNIDLDDICHAQAMDDDCKPVIELLRT